MSICSGRGQGVHGNTGMFGMEREQVVFLGKHVHRLSSGRWLRIEKRHPEKER